MLIDEGSSVDILFLATYHQLGLKDECLKLPRSQVLGFGNHKTMPKGEIGIPNSLLGNDSNHLHNMVVEYLVVQSSAAYDGIMGRPMIHSF